MKFADKTPEIYLERLQSVRRRFRTLIKRGKSRADAVLYLSDKFQINHRTVRNYLQRHPSIWQFVSNSN